MTKVTKTQLRKMPVGELIDLCQDNGVFVWHDSTKPDMIDLYWDALTRSEKVDVST